MLKGSHLFNLPSLVRFSRPHHENQWQEWRGDALTIELQGDGIRRLGVHAVAAR
jgi:hypothetical protein